MVSLHANCLFRVNSFGDANNCDCSACPNRYTGLFQIQSNRTLTVDEIKEFENKYRTHSDFRIGDLK